MIFYTSGKNLTIYANDDIHYPMERYEWWLYRSPKIDISKPYICCIGDSFTFGRTVNYPYPTLLAPYVKYPIINLSRGHLSPKFIIKSSLLLRLIQNSALAIIQFKTPSDQITKELKIPFILLDLNNFDYYPTQKDHHEITKITYELIKNKFPDFIRQ